MSDMWNGVAPAWERNATFVDEHLAAATDALLDLVKVAPGAAVLDLATGPGGAGLAAAKRVGPSGMVVLADVASEMVAVAARRAAGYPTVTTAVCDQSAIQAADASFDAVISRHGLMFAPDPAAAVQEAARVLRTDGRYGAMTWDARESNPWLGLILDSVGEQFGVPFPPAGIAGPFSLSDAGSLVESLERGGLKDVEVQAVATPMAAASLAAWWERVPQLAGPLAVALEGMEPEIRDAIRQRALDAAAAVARASGDEIILDGSVLIAAGTRPA
ncbi:MAG: class I SAM-dependent methyltransferase [Solirubrobacteraceae bacterium]